MTLKEFQINESASLIFQYANAVYKLNLHLESGFILLEKLKKNQKKRDIVSTVFLPCEEKDTSVIIKEENGNEETTSND